MFCARSLCAGSISAVPLSSVPVFLCPSLAQDTVALTAVEDDVRPRTEGQASSQLPAPFSLFSFFSPWRRQSGSQQPAAPPLRRSGVAQWTTQESGWEGKKKKAAVTRGTLLGRPMTPLTPALRGVQELISGMPCNLPLARRTPVRSAKG